MVFSIFKILLSMCLPTAVGRRSPHRNCPPYQASEGGPWRSRHVSERAGLQALRSLGNLRKGDRGGNRGGSTIYHNFTSNL